MNLKEIRDDVRSLIIEPQQGFRSDIELNRWINQAHQELAMYYRIDDKADIPLQPGVSFYKAPEDLLSLKGAWDSEGNSISVIPVTSGSELAEDEGEEITLFTLGDYLVVVPAPPADEEADDPGVITIFYERSPKQLITDTDVPEIAEPYHKYLVSFAAMRAFAKDEDFEASAIYEAEYLRGKEEIAGHRVPISKDANTILELVRLGILNAAEAAEWLNIPMKKKVWKRVEVEEKGMALMQTGVIDKADLLKNTEFIDRDKIIPRLTAEHSDLIELPSWNEKYVPPEPVEDDDEVEETPSPPEDESHWDDWEDVESFPDDDDDEEDEN